MEFITNKKATNKLYMLVLILNSYSNWSIILKKNKNYFSKYSYIIPKTEIDSNIKCNVLGEQIIKNTIDIEVQFQKLRAFKFYPEYNIFAFVYWTEPNSIKSYLKSNSIELNFETLKEVKNQIEHANIIEDSLREYLSLIALKHVNTDNRLLYGGC